MVILRLLARLSILLVWLAYPVQVMAQRTVPVSEAKLEFVIEDSARSPFEREMVMATLRGTYRVNMTLEEIVMPRMRDIEWVQLDRSLWRQATVDGKSVRIMERRYALFPQEAGKTAIKPAVHKMTILDSNGKRQDIEVRSEPVALDVKPALAATGEWWLPAKGVEVTDEWSADPGSLGDGDSVRRTVTVTALGATEQMIPPQPAMRQPWLITFADPEQRSMQLTQAGPLTTVTWAWTLRPRTGEPGVLPQVTIPWFDTVERESRNAVIAAQPFGYAGFGDNTAVRWQAGFSGILPASLVFLAGMLLPVFFWAPQGRLRRPSDIAAAFKTYSPDPHLRRLRRALRAHDPLAAREAAMAALRRVEPDKRAAIAFEIDQFDRLLFGRGGGDGVGAVELRVFERSIRRALRLIRSR